MTEQLRNKLSDSKTLRWSVLALVAFTMLCGYFLTDVMSPLKPMLEKELLWDSLGIHMKSVMVQARQRLFI